MVVEGSEDAEMSRLAAAVPVGFRFHPTDEELVGYYLPKKVGAMKIDLDLIRDLDLYKLEPWDLQELCKIQADATEKQTDYYFFSRKDRKYPTGNRANRATTQGFWKATGRDKPIHTKLHAVIGMRKTLVFYQGRAPHGLKTDWIMHEFRLDDGPGRPAHEDGGWVVCRVFKKSKSVKAKVVERATVSYEDSRTGLLPDAACSPDILSGEGLVKREVVNLDEYQTLAPPSTSEQIRSYLTRTLSSRDTNFYSCQEAPPCHFNDDPVSGMETVDWSSLLLQEPAAPAADMTILLQLKRQNSDMFSSLDLWNYSQVAQHM